MKRTWIDYLLLLCLATGVIVLLADASQVLGSNAIRPSSGPALISYQGYLSDVNGQPINGPTDFRFALYASETGGSALWTEMQAAIPVIDGFFSVLLGSVNPLSPIDFEAPTRYLEVSVDTGSGFVTMPRQPLASVPYAFRADVAEVAPWDGLTGVPAGFADGLDDDTTYTTLPGLILSGTQLGVDTTVVQARVSDGCTVGSTIRQINTNGSVECELHDPYNRAAPPAVTIATNLDDTGGSERGTSVTIGRDGLALISYYDAINDDLKVAHCSDRHCGEATIATLDSVGDVGRYSSVALGSDDLGIISYRDTTNEDLKVAHCNDVLCSNASLTTLDSSEDVGSDSAITIGTGGYPIISYYDNSNDDLKVARCNDIVCGSAIITTLDSIGNVGRTTAIVTGIDQHGLISYYDSDLRNLKVAHCDNVDCTSATITTLDAAGDVGAHSSVTIGSDGLGLISYYDASNEALKVAHCDNLACMSATISTLPFAGTVGGYTSITIDDDGLGLISYLGGDAVRILRCNNLMCSSSRVFYVDAEGLFISITIGADGLPLISYYQNGNLKVAHCSNVFCTPFFRRR